MKSNIELDRRKVLGTVGGLAVAGSGFAALTGGATATSGSLDIGDSEVHTDDGDLTEVNVKLDHTVTWDGFDIPVHAAEYRDVIRVYDSNNNLLGSHVLRDETDTPKMLENWSGDGDSNGWGGDGEHTSGPGTEGNVNADILWTVLSDSDNTPTHSIPQGQPASVEDFGLDNETDGSVRDYTVEFVKTVRLYTKDSGGSYTASDGTSLRLMGGDDGTVGEVKSSGTFTLSVGNEAASTSGTGSGGSSAS